MTLAAIYARYSSDSQREESIEIQIERCQQLIERQGWVTGEVYTDYAITGTDDKRPSFQRCIADGVAGEYDVLVFYKGDRFARNVAQSRSYKDRLREAGVRLFSVREGELKDTPDGFLHEVMDEAFAEYYSRNLSMLINEGIRKNVEKCKANGRTIVGYTINKEGYYDVDEGVAPFIRGAFEQYLKLGSCAEVRRYLTERGVTNTRGTELTDNQVLKMLKNDAYIGTYRFAGAAKEDAMPAIVDKNTFYEVRRRLEVKHKSKKRVGDRNYMLTGTLHCLDCGNAMGGTSGISKTGAKHSYYTCRNKGCDAPNYKAWEVEKAVCQSVKEIATDPAIIDDMVACMVDYAEHAVDNRDLLAEELAHARRRRDNLVNSIAEGIPAATVKDALTECEERIADLDMKIARIEFEKTRVIDEDAARAMVASFMDKALNDEERMSLMVGTFIHQCFINREHLAIVLRMGETQKDFTAEEILELINTKTPSDLGSLGVRLIDKWWTNDTLIRTLYFWRGVFVLVLPRSK